MSRLIVVDDSVLFRAGLVRVLTAEGFTIVAESADPAGLRSALAQAGTVDGVILDIRMPPTYRTEGLTAATGLRATHRTLPVMLLSQYVEAGMALDLLTGRHQAGTGYLLKDRVTSIASFVSDLRRVLRGEVVVDPDVATQLMRAARAQQVIGRLSPREEQILGLVAVGRSNAGIATLLRLTERTVESHIASIFGKLDLVDLPDDNRRVLAVLAYLRRPGQVIRAEQAELD